MIKFFRHIRQRMIKENRFSKYILYAIGEIVLVVIGILLALQINNWNKLRKDKKEQYFLLEKLQTDLYSDKNQITTKIYAAENGSENFIFCLDVLARMKTASRKEFMSRFGGILAINYFNQNTTTFDNLVSSGKIELIENQALLDSIVDYYTEDHSAWDSAMKDYTRNIIAPYIMANYHMPQMDQTKGFDFDEYRRFYAEDLSRFDVKSKTLDEYRKDVFVINALRQKTFNLQGQASLYQNLQKYIDGLLIMIEEEKERLKNN